MEREGSDDLEALSTELRVGWLGGTPPSYWVTRFFFLRGLGLVYLIAFLVAAFQLEGLIGSRGLLPVAPAFDQLRADLGSTAYWRVPSLFWIDASDSTLEGLAWVGVALSAVVLGGGANAPLLFVLWALQLSFVYAGQTFWGYGWEILLLEAGFLAVFLAPAWRVRPFEARSPPPAVVLWLLRWLVFRVMFGAGLIKIRGDACWTELTCLAHHYETQPVPNPLSPAFHHLPLWFHQAGVLFNHLVELVVPFGVFGPRRVRHVAGALIVAFQVVLILSGNLSFLNWLTIVIALACFDDSLLGRLLPRRLRVELDERDVRVPTSRRVVTGVLAFVVGVLSLNPVVNMLSPRQQMNAGFDPFHLVNTYGAFGSVERVRREVVLEGTSDASLDESTEWREYELPCKPGRVDRRPCWISPYHYRLDWQMWFAALGSYRREPWIVHLAYKLLAGEPAVLGLFDDVPFEDEPPRHVRAVLYRYELVAPGDDTEAWWRRDPVGEYLRPLSLDDPGLRAFLERRGWGR